MQLLSWLPVLFGFVKLCELALLDRSDRDAAIERLDLLMAEGLDWEVEHYAGNLIVAELREAQGDLPKALAAVRQRTFNWYGPGFLSTYLREEGRLAALTGDTVGAIKAYRHYLALRSDPEPHLVPQRDSIRVELERLLNAGEHVLKDGEHTGATPGRVVRGPGWTGG